MYDLRSTWASNALEAGVDIKVVSERLGHSDVRFTLQVYVRTVEAQHRNAALDTQALYGSKPDLTTKTIEVKAQPAKKKQALPRARKALPEKLLPPSCHQRANSEKGRNEKPLPMTGISFGGAEGIRTLDLLNAIQTRSQLRHSPRPTESSMNTLDMQAWLECFWGKRTMAHSRKFF